VSGRTSTGRELRERPRFSNAEDEASYWKQIAEEYIGKLQDVREEFEEYREGSRELEAELEAQLEEYERRVTDLLTCKCELEEENEMQKAKINANERQTFLQVTQLQDENAQLKGERGELSKYVRDLEQMNDDLERSKRATICSLEEFEIRLNNAIERNAFLENELEEKEQLMVAVQRLKDESRDLKAELAKNSRGKNLSTNSARNSSASSGRSSIPITSRSSPANSRSSSKATSITAAQTENYPSCGAISMFVSQMPFLKNNGSKLKMSALNIVGDLINKVGALEEKLASCRNFSQDQPRNIGRQQMGYGVQAMIDSVNATNGRSKTKSWH